MFQRDVFSISWAWLEIWLWIFPTSMVVSPTKPHWHTDMPWIWSSSYIYIYMLYIYIHIYIYIHHIYPEFDIYIYIWWIWIWCLKRGWKKKEMVLTKLCFDSIVKMIPLLSYPIHILWCWIPIWWSLKKRDPQFTIALNTKIRGSWLGCLNSFGGTPMTFETSADVAPPSSFGCSRDTSRSSQSLDSVWTSHWKSEMALEQTFTYPWQHLALTYYVTPCNMSIYIYIYYIYICIYSIMWNMFLSDNVYHCLTLH